MEHLGKRTTMKPPPKPQTKPHIGGISPSTSANPVGRIYSAIAASKGDEAVEKTVHVSGFNPRASENELKEGLKEFFARSGEVKDVVVIKRKRMVIDYAFVQFGSMVTEVSCNLVFYCLIVYIETSLGEFQRTI